MSYGYCIRSFSACPNRLPTKAIFADFVKLLSLFKLKHFRELKQWSLCLERPIGSSWAGLELTQDSRFLTCEEIMSFLVTDPLHIMGMQPIWRTKQNKCSLLGIEIYSHVKKIAELNFLRMLGSLAWESIFLNV